MTDGEQLGLALLLLVLVGLLGLIAILSGSCDGGF